jgi:hypothetical protein
VQKKPQLTPLAWVEAGRSERTKFIDAAGVDSILEAMTPEQRSIVTVAAKLDDEEREGAEESINPALQEEDARAGMPKFFVRDAETPAALPEPNPESEPSMQQAVAAAAKWLKPFSQGVQSEICNCAIARLAESM